MKKLSHLIPILTTAIFFVCLSTHAQTGMNKVTPTGTTLCCVINCDAAVIK